MTQTQLYNEVVAITEDYLGPAAERFISRQIQFHLGKQPSELAREDMPKLIEWVKVSLALLTGDAEMLADFETRVAKI